MFSEIAGCARRHSANRIDTGAGRVRRHRRRCCEVFLARHARSRCGAPAGRLARAPCVYHRIDMKAHVSHVRLLGAHKYVGNPATKGVAGARPRDALYLRVRKRDRGAQTGVEATFPESCGPADAGMSSLGNRLSQVGKRLHVACGRRPVSGGDGRARNERRSRHLWELQFPKSAQECRQARLPYLLG